MDTGHLHLRKTIKLSSKEPMSFSVSKERNLIDSILQFLQNFIGLSIVLASQREIVFRVFSLTKDLSTFK